MTNPLSIFRPQSFSASTQLCHPIGIVPQRAGLAIKLVFALACLFLSLLIFVDYLPIKRLPGKVATIPSATPILLPPGAVFVRWLVDDGEQLIAGQPIADIMWRDRVNQPQLMQATSSLISAQRQHAISQHETKVGQLTRQKSQLQHSLKIARQRQQLELQLLAEANQLVEQYQTTYQQLAKLADLDQVSKQELRRAKQQQFDATVTLNQLQHQLDKSEVMMVEARHAITTIDQQLSVANGQYDTQLQQLAVNQRGETLQLTTQLRSPINGVARLKRQAQAAGTLLAVVEPSNAYLGFESWLPSAADIERAGNGASVRISHLPWVHEGTFKVRLVSADRLPTTNGRGSTGYRALFRFEQQAPSPIVGGDLGELILTERPIKLGAYLLLPSALTKAR